jgi:hypothetical protein
MWSRVPLQSNRSLVYQKAWSRWRFSAVEYEFEKPLSPVGCSVPRGCSLTPEEYWLLLICKCFDQWAKSPRQKNSATDRTWSPDGDFGRTKVGVLEPPHVTRGTQSRSPRKPSRHRSRATEFPRPCLRGTASGEIGYALEAPVDGERSPRS